MARSRINELLRNRTFSLSGTDYKLHEEFWRTAYANFTIASKRSRENAPPSAPSVYNLEFSPSNCYTVLACDADGGISVCDTRLESKVCCVFNAHGDGVNVISFIDPFLFATGSDDKNIKIWDLRMLKPVALLKGHEGWVKNIEFDRHSNSLFSVAFHDGVRKWSIDRLDLYEGGMEDNLLFEIPEIVRLRISPDSSTMIMSLRKDHLVVLYNFDGNTVEEVKSVVPRAYPLSHDVRDKLIQDCKAYSKNTPSIHVIADGPHEYTTPLSMVYHPASGFVAMRLVNVLYDAYIAQESTVLYDLQESSSCVYHDLAMTNKCTIRHAIEYSPDSVQDYIKEISFSKPDGRVLASPYGNSVRLLATDRLCTPMDLYYDERYSSSEKKLMEGSLTAFEKISVCNKHKDGVLTCRLNSDSMCLVSGCVDGSIIFNWPRL